jgi:hypothetical protein
MANPSVAVDAHNRVHLVYSTWTKNKVERLPDLSYYRVRRNNTWTQPTAIGAQGFSAKIARDRTNRLHLCWQEGLDEKGRPRRLLLRIWDAARSSPTISIKACPAGGIRFSAVPDGGLLASWSDLNAVIVQSFLYE